ncbi:AMP-binding protein [Bradyrhizobium sp. Ai1a-2]|uniref:AMP-binding protein n=1 Tax=Bradyrhizobium sp. Ai1a-2 TaxID=196490 RepID=UPI0004268292|nr:AMP-binding protein [Bradyrhizobium sp. Ai1a-2]
MDSVGEHASPVSSRELRLAPRQVLIDDRSDGTKILKSPIEFRSSDRSVLDLLSEWASRAPDRIFLAQRTPDGGWQEMTYREMWRRVQAAGQGLINLGAARGDRLAILSGNSIEHAIVMFAAMAIDVVVAPISPSYSLLPGGMARIEDIAKVLRPNFVFAQSREPYFAARRIREFAGATWITSEGAGAEAVELERLYSTEPEPAFFERLSSIDVDRPAKILFTSGSTGLPKGVINTHRMMMCTIEMTALLVSSDADDSRWPVQVEWLPWHHTMGSNIILHGVLRDGGTLYIDDGRPLPHLFHRTIANLKEVSPTKMLSVPGGYTLLCEALAADPQLRTSFFRRLDALMYGGSAIARPTLDKLKELAIATIGRPVPILSGYGATETAPLISATHWTGSEPGEIGLPAPGIQLKLVPHGDAYEARVKGPNVTPGYLEMPDATRAAFDEEGFYRVGDLVSFVDPADPNMGLRFAGRVSENFKLSNGTWVVAGALRTALLAATEGVLQDVVIAGENRDRCALLAWLNSARAKQYATGSNKAEDRDLCCDPGVIAFIRERLQRHNKATGSSERIVSFILSDEPPSLGAGEITDKAYINQRAVLNRRREQVEMLYGRPTGVGVIVV